MIIDHPSEIFMPFHQKYVFAMAMDMQCMYKVYECKMVVKQMIRKKKSFNRSNVSTCIFVRTVLNVFEYLLRQVGTNEIFFGSLRQWGVAATRMKPRGGGGALNTEQFSQNNTQLCLSGGCCGLDLSQYGVVCARRFQVMDRSGLLAQGS